MHDGQRDRLSLVAAQRVAARRRIHTGVFARGARESLGQALAQESADRLRREALQLAIQRVHIDAREPIREQRHALARLYRLADSTD